jgi:hypothetical protein
MEQCTQYLVPELKRPDRVIEKYEEDPGVPGSKENFSSRIFVELKSAKGESLVKAVEQATSSMEETVDNAGGDFSTYMVIVKGKYIAFFEYHNDRSLLYEDGVLNIHGAIPFNLAKHYALNSQEVIGRPSYKGSGRLKMGFAEGERNLSHEGIYLPLDTEDVTVQWILNWMKDNKPLEVTKSSTAQTGFSPSVPFDSAPFSDSMDTEY